MAEEIKAQEAAMQENQEARIPGDIPDEAQAIRESVLIDGDEIRIITPDRLESFNTLWDILDEIDELRGLKQIMGEASLGTLESLADEVDGADSFKKFLSEAREVGRLLTIYERKYEALKLAVIGFVKSLRP